MAEQLAQPSSDRKKENRINIIPGYVEPADMQEIKRVVAELGVKSIMFPDTSRVLDGPMTGRFNMYPSGGVTVDNLGLSSSSMGTVALGRLASGPAGVALDTKFRVPCEIIDLPIGLNATDAFINTLRLIAGVQVPDSLTYERGQLLDVMADMQQYFYHKKVALVGDPDQLVALTEFLVTLDMWPIHILTGSPDPKFEDRIRAITKNIPHPVNIKANGDMFLFHQWIKNDAVDLMLGNTYVKYIARDEDIPFIRYGFPILDRVGHSFFPSVGYRGGLRLLEKILDALLDRKDRDSSEIGFELVM